MRFPGLTRLKAHLCGILNLGRCVSICFTVCLVGQNVRVEYYFFGLWKVQDCFDFVCRFIEFVFALTRLVFCRVLFIMAGSMDMGTFGFFTMPGMTK